MKIPVLQEHGRFSQAHRVLKPDGSLFFHIDFREVHDAKVLLGDISWHNWPRN